VNTTTNPFYAWEIHPQPEVLLEPAPTNREWMDASDQRFAYRCLPLVLANQSGWFIRSPVQVTARWNGGSRLKDLRLWFPRSYRGRQVLSHFGQGILTFTLPFLFRTPPGINLWVKGPANHFKDGIQPLEGVVETDWSESTFTMNWKLTRPDHTVRFNVGEPICMLVPVARGTIDSLQPIRKPLHENQPLKEQYEKWSESRKAFNEALANQDSEIVKQGWQKDYMLGRDGSGQRIATHQTRLAVREFRTE
jgi:hypothetical protein